MPRTSSSGLSRRFAFAVPVTAIAIAAAACGSSSSTGKTTTQPSAAKSSAPASTTLNDNPSPDKVQDGGTLTYGADQSPTGFNDNTSKDNGTANANIVEAVLPSAAQGTPSLGFRFNPYLFSSTPTEISTSPETIEYKISPKAVWSDGVPIDVTDFQYLFNALNGKDTGYDAASTTGYSSIKSVEAKNGDKKDVIVTFATPFPDWQSLFGSVGGNFLLPAHIAEKMSGDKHKIWDDGFDNTTYVSGGPYEIQSYNKGNDLTLVPNPKWYGPKPHLSSIVYRFLPDSTTQPQALSNGEVNMIYPQPQLDLVNQVKAIPGVSSELNFGESFEHIDFNLKTPGLSDLAVRQAIATAISDPALIARTVGQFSSKATPLGNRIYLSNQKQYVDNSGPYLKGNVAGAKAILAKAGYVAGSDGILAKGGTKLSFTFTTTAGNALRQTTFQLFQAQMKQIGIDIKADIRPSDAVFPDLAAHKFQISLFAWVGNPFPISSNQGIYSTGGGSNYGFITDPKVDSLFKQAFASSDTATQVSLANQIDKELWAGVYTIPLYQKPTFIAYKSTFGNVHDNPTQDGPFWNVVNWGMKVQ